MFSPNYMTFTMSKDYFRQVHNPKKFLCNLSILLRYTHIKREKYGTFVKMIWYCADGHYINADTVGIFKVMWMQRHFSFELTQTVDTLMIIGVSKIVHLFHVLAVLSLHIS